ncbi:MAG: glycoside hydrolase family 32 protein [Pirellulales bacterium]|nr:glycoside hydrolase family 32 protein [Pirellulales bacterium]
MFREILAVMLFFLPLAAIPADDDILIADFEIGTYGDWERTGEAFVSGPAQGTLHDQMRVDGYRGSRLVNSYCDHIVLTSNKPNVPEYRQLENRFPVTDEYLVIPIKNGAVPTELILEINGTPVRRYNTELAIAPEDIDWYAFFNIASYRGQQARVIAKRATEEAFAQIRQTHVVPGSDTWYTEKLRPQFHFSQVVGWNNDPNGMVFHDGHWHLFFQHNPVGWNWGNMTWGHAISRDLIHWEQLPNALFPRTMAVGDCFSGGGTVDIQNTAGWKTGTEDVLVVFLTDTGAGESLAYSNDGGRTFTWYPGNPVVKHRGRDPKVIWYEYDHNDVPLSDRAKDLGGHWVMAVYDEHDQYGQNIAFYSSVDLKQWEEQSHLAGYFECPELFELPVDGDKNNTRWIVFAADARYAIGHFDGRLFKPVHEGKHQVHWGSYYASQTFSNAPNGRRIQIGWVKIASPGMPFNQTFSFPHELTLRTTTDGIRLFAEPIQEIEKLHQRQYRIEPCELVEGAPIRVDVDNELFDIRAEFEIGDAKQVGLDIGGNRIIYDVAAKRLGEAELMPGNGCVSMQILVDRTMLEVCGNEGRVCITAERSQKGHVDAIHGFAKGDRARLIRLDIHELASIWQGKSAQADRPDSAEIPADPR